VTISHIVTIDTFCRPEVSWSRTAACQAPSVAQVRKGVVVGLGRYQGGKFDLVLSVRHAANAARILEWEQSFRRASEILYDATDGQMQFGRVYLANNSRGSAEADCFLMEPDGTSFTTTPIPGLGTADLHTVLQGDERRKPFM
jgi:hypothetical protein